jgi:hypothetical protein
MNEQELARKLLDDSCYNPGDEPERRLFRIELHCKEFEVSAIRNKSTGEYEDIRIEKEGPC